MPCAELLANVFRFCPLVFVHNVARLVCKKWYVASKFAQLTIDHEAALFLEVLHAKQKGTEPLAVTTIHAVVRQFLLQAPQNVAVAERAIAMCSSSTLRAEVFHVVQSVALAWLPLERTLPGFAPAGKLILHRLGAGEKQIGVAAPAGAGKSTFSVQLIRHTLSTNKSASVLFTAFNTLIVEDIHSRMATAVASTRHPSCPRALPVGLTVSTLHALALRRLRECGLYKEKIIDNDDAALVRAFRCELEDDDDPEDSLNELSLYCQGRLRFPEDAVVNVYERMFDMDDPLGQTYDAMMYWFANEGHDMQHTLIIVDEAQDMNTTMRTWLTHQHSAQKIFLGDSSQSINGYMGASDVLETMADLVAFPASRRFGPAVARLVNRIHVLVGVNRPLLYATGYDTVIEPLLQEVTLKGVTFLSSTNRCLFERALRAVANGHTVHFLGKFFETFKDIHTNRSQLADFAEQLKKSKRGKWWHHIFISDPAKFCERLQTLEENSTTAASANLCLGTAFVTKGLEFDHVELGSDFQCFKPAQDSKNQKMWALLVACTRAVKTLHIPAFPGSGGRSNTLWQFLML
jgi:hypothetical protein